MQVEIRAHFLGKKSASYRLGNTVGCDCFLSHRFQFIVYLLSSEIECYIFWVTDNIINYPTK